MAAYLGGPRTAAAARAATLVAALSGLCAACVVTTHEGPGDPPAVPARPATTAGVETAGASSADPASPSAKPDDGPQTISASHLLVMHAGSMRAPATITRSREEARARAEEALAQAREGATFTDLVTKYSDEPGAAMREGRLGRFNRDAMIQQFADAAFALEPGELSGVVETPFGFHVILRTE